MNHYLFRQIRIENNLYLKIKMFCVQNEIALFQFYENSLRWFLRLINQEKINYRATYRKGKLLTVRVNGYLAELVKKLAMEANVSEACVIYTAIITYIEANPLM
jgi:hypothetical protein